MLNQIISGISSALTAAFGGEAAVYSEGTGQGDHAPCFFIVPLSPTQTQIIGNRYRLEHPFDIRYFPGEVQERESKMNGVAEKLMLVLEYVETEAGLLRGTKMHYEKTDGVLHFFVNYNMHVRRDIPKEDPMNELTAESGLKE